MNKGFMDVPEGILRGLGLVVVSWSHLEGAAFTCLLRLMNMGVGNVENHILLSHLSFSEQISAIGALLGERINFDGTKGSQVYKEEVHALLDIAKQTRDELIHSVWGVESDGSVSRARGRNISLTGAIAQSDADELAEAAALIDRARVALYEVCALQ